LTGTCTKTGTSILGLLAPLSGRLHAYMCTVLGGNSAGANVEVVDKGGNSALTAAIHNDNAYMICMLLAAGAPVLNT
jgi:hypothetical protein